MPGPTPSTTLTGQPAVLYFSASTEPLQVGYHRSDWSAALASFQHAVRVHEVAGTARAVKIGRAIRDAGREGAA